MDWYHISIAKSKGKESSVDVDCLDLYPPASLNISSIRIPTAGGFVPVHSPLRHYYIFRNRMLLNRRSSIPLHWKYNNAV